MKFYYHVLDEEMLSGGTPEGEERVAMDWQPMPQGMVSPPRIGETMTLGSIDAKSPLLLKVISVHWEIGPALARCLITVVDEEASMTNTPEMDLGDLSKTFSNMGKR